MIRPLILCADDFGLTPGVNEAILDLCARGRLSGVSAMVTAPAWRADATRLRDFGGASGVEVGIHLCFSEFPPLTAAPSLAPGGRPRGQGRLLAAILAGRLRRREIVAEIARQIETFAGAVGRLPDFLDGHHHAHQFPLLGRLVIEAIAARAPAWRPWLRVCADRPSGILGRGRGVLDAATASLLGQGLRRRARAAGIATNEGISGFYKVREAASYAQIFPDFLRATGPRHLVVCHPGRCADAAERARPWMACREHEYAFLAGEDFAALCARAGVRVATFAETAAG